MSRKWERQVERNAKKANAQRKRMGQTSIDQTSKAKTEDKHLGRSWMLALFLVFVSLFYMITFWSVDRSGLYWVTVFSYVGLALIIFVLRRPFLTIGKDSLTTRKFAGFRTIYANDIEEIEAMKGYVIISLKGKRSKWVFSRMMNRYNTDLMAEKLKEFSRVNQVRFKQV